MASLTIASCPTNLRITEQVFAKLYPDLAKYYNHFNTPVPYGTSKVEFERKYLQSKLWRLNNLYTVIDKHGNKVRFRMNYAQHRVYAAMRVHPRIIVLKSRQQGISTFTLINFFDDCIFCSNLNIGLMAQGKDEAATLLERVKLLWEELDGEIKNFLRIRLSRNNSVEFSFSNASTIFIRVSFRSTTLQRLHISEFGKIANQYPKRAKETKTGSLQALAPGNAGVVESTAEGRNDFKFMWDNATIAQLSGQMAAKDFMPVFLPWFEDPDCTSDVKQTVDADAAKYFAKIEEELNIELSEAQKNFWIIQRRELESDISQEYPATPEEAFTAARDGTYYARKFNELVVQRRGLVKDLYDPNLDTDVYFDLGVDDYTVLVFVQWYRGKYRLVKEHFDNGLDLEHYVDWIANTGIPIRELVFPHDVKKRQMLSNNSHGGVARTIYEGIQDYIRSKSLNWRTRATDKVSLLDGIQAVRRIIPNMLVDLSCTYIISCMQNYSKTYDDKLQTWSNTPVHDEYSHGADCIRQIAVHHSETGTSSMEVQRHVPSSGFSLG